MRSPFVFCAVLSLITVVAGLLMSFMVSAMNPSPMVSATIQSGAGLTFYCFLPMCFYMVALVTTRLQRENQDLRDQIQELRDDFTGLKEVA